MNPHALVVQKRTSGMPSSAAASRVKLMTVEVGHVWLELPSPIILLNQIQAVLGNPIQLGL